MSDALRPFDQAGIRYRAVPNSHEIILCCPWCRKDWKFYYNTVKRVGFCQVHRRGHTFVELAQALHLPGTTALGPQAPTPSELQQQVDAVFGGPKPGTEEQKLPQHQLPFGCYPAWKYAEAVDYLICRDLTTELIMQHQLGYCPYGPFARRIVFPVFWGGVLVGFTARSIDKDVEPKYMFPKGMPAGRVLYPEMNLRMGRLVVTEGVIPAIMLRGVCTFGKSLSEKQLKVLIRASDFVQQIVLAWDRDAWFSKTEDKSPAQRAWDTLSKYYPVVGLIFDSNTPQPDHLGYSEITNVVEKTWRKEIKEQSESTIWAVSEHGRAQRIV